MDTRKRVLRWLMVCVLCWMAVEVAAAGRLTVEPEDFSAVRPVEPRLVPAALVTARATEVEHLDEFAEWAWFYADYYSYLAEDEGARAAMLEEYAVHTPPGDERDRLEDRAQVYRAREELNMLRSILALEWYNKISVCAEVLRLMRTE